MIEVIPPFPLTDEYFFSFINLNDVDWKYFSMMIEMRRRHLGLALEDIADLLELPLGAVVDATTGKSLPASFYFKLSCWYGVCVEWFYKAEVLATRQVR